MFDFNGNGKFDATDMFFLDMIFDEDDKEANQESDEYDFGDSEYDNEDDYD